MDYDVKTHIELVRERPALWDSKHDDYHNRHAIEKKWIEMSELMKVPPVFLKKKWKYLRDQFRVESKKIPPEKYYDLMLPLEELDAYTSWIFFKPLFFLRTQIKIPKKKNHSNDENEEDEEEPMEMSADNTTQDQLDIGKMFVFKDIASITHKDYEEQTLQFPKEAPTKNVSTKNHITNDYDDRTLERLEKKIDAAIAQQRKRKNSDDEIDEDNAFFASILPHIQKLTPAKKMLCRIDIQNIVYSHAYKTD